MITTLISLIFRVDWLKIMEDVKHQCQIDETFKLREPDVSFDNRFLWIFFKKHELQMELKEVE
jgi:hypothetical protein